MNVLACTYILLTRPGAGGGWWGHHSPGTTPQRSSAAFLAGKKTSPFFSEDKPIGASPRRNYA